MNNDMDHRNGVRPAPVIGHPGIERASPAFILNLADKCAHVSGSSWDLDRAIFRACHLPEVWFGSRVISWFGDGPFGCNTADGIRHLDCVNAPNYTASIDAATSLVPDRYYWHAGFGRVQPDEPFGGASIIEPGSHLTIAEAEAASVALALCAAALRARAALLLKVTAVLDRARQQGVFD